MGNLEALSDQNLILVVLQPTTQKPKNLEILESRRLLTKHKKQNFQISLEEGAENDTCFSSVDPPVQFYFLKDII